MHQLIRKDESVTVNIQGIFMYIIRRKHIHERDMCIKEKRRIQNGENKQRNMEQCNERVKNRKVMEEEKQKCRFYENIMINMKNRFKQQVMTTFIKP